ncbi:MAG: sugar ABC transporter permease [Clostridia bacterium]|nr:sugar ABC transporter permease [Clostridia bacterium]
MKKTAGQGAEKKNAGKFFESFKANFSGWMLIVPSLILFILIVWRPIVIGISYSFFELRGVTPAEFVGLENFRQVLADTNFIKTLLNTVKYVFWSLIIGFPMPFIAALMLNEMVNCKGYFKVAMYLPVVIPGMATCLIWKMIYMDGGGGFLNMLLYFFGIGPLNWLSNANLTIPLIVIMMSWHGFGTTLIMYLATMQSINQELYEAARLDGAGFWGRIRHVLIPHMSGTMLLLGIRQIISVFQVTEQPLVMTDGGPNGASTTLGLTGYNYAFRYGQYDKAMALGVISFLILLVLTFIYFYLDKKTQN